MKFLLFLLVIPLIGAPKVLALQYSNYTAPEGWSTTYPTSWLVGHNYNVPRVSGPENTTFYENQSKFKPFDDSNVSISIGIMSNAENETYASYFYKNNTDLCGEYALDGNNACIQLFTGVYGFYGGEVTTTIAGKNYDLEFDVKTHDEFDRYLPIFFQMLGTFHGAPEAGRIGNFMSSGNSSSSNANMTSSNSPTSSFNPFGNYSAPYIVVLDFHADTTLTGALVADSAANDSNK